MKALLVLEDGKTFEGISLGVAGNTQGEVVFNTGMTGYQEILTDPSYAGQIVTLTYPLIGNYGINEEDGESRDVQLRGLIVHETADIPSNWRSSKTLHAYLTEKSIVAIQGIDTRALTRHLRGEGVKMGTITTNETAEEALSRLKSSPRYESVELNKLVTTENTYLWNRESTTPDVYDPTSIPSEKFRVAVIDCGVKYNILRSLATLNCETVVFPCTASDSEILACNPNGIMLSPGPGDPSHLGYLVETVRRMVGIKPIMGVCLGNQILGSVFGSKTFKLKFGHRGSNHPVKDLNSGKVYITSQNHGYAVDPDALKDGMEVAHVNLNDGTVEGLKHKELPIFSIQYHPEASPGPKDSMFFFEEFVRSFS